MKYQCIQVSIASGYGYLESNNHNVLRIDWAETLFEVTDNSAEYIYINENSNFSQAASIPDITNTIVLGRVITNNGEVTLIDRSLIDAEHTTNKLITFNRKALGSIYERGSLVVEGATFSLDVSRGSYYFGSKNYMPDGGLGITFSQFVLDGTNWIITDTNIVTNLYDDGNGSLVGMSASYYTKHTLYVNGEGDTEKYLLVVGQQQYEGAIEVEGAALPIPPNYFEDAIVPIASIIVQEGLGTIYNILDIRPVIGFKSTGINAASTHANLQGLLADDHKQYLLVNGNRSMQNDLLMASNSIVGVGQVNGVTIESHASRHLPNGVDPLTTGIPETIGTSNVEGIQNAFARQDHIHAHGDQLGGSLHATASQSTAGFMSAQDKLALDVIKNSYISKVGSSSQLLSATGSIVNIGAGLTMSIGGTLSVIVGIGATGATGPAGARGATGAAGSNGTNGTSGTSGAAGPQGPEGPQGPPGTGGESIPYLYKLGTIESSVESTLVQLSGLVIHDNQDVYERYKLKGKVSFKNNSSLYVLLVGVISISEGAKIINTANSSTVVASGVNTFVNTMTPFTVNGLVRDFTTGNIIPLTSAFFILDNSIASINDYFITLFAGSSQIFSGYVEIDLEILISQGANVTYSN